VFLMGNEVAFAGGLLVVGIDGPCVAPPVGHAELLGSLDDPTEVVGAGIVRPDRGGDGALAGGDENRGVSKGC
jgi:hypothetical protein